MMPMEKVAMMDAMIILVGTVVVKVMPVTVTLFIYFFFLIFVLITFEAEYIFRVGRWNNHLENK